jgi:hypothetical protein
MRRLLSAAIVLVVLAFGTAAAQPKGGAAPDPKRVEAIKNRIRGLRAQTLTDELKLDNTALSKVLPILSKWDDVTDKLVRERVDIRKRLANAGSITDPKALDRLVDDAIANQKQFYDLEDKRLAELRKVLTPGQTAKLIVVLPEFERKIQNQLRRAVMRAGRAGPASPGVGADSRTGDDDDDDEDAGPPRRRR